MSTYVLNNNNNTNSNNDNTSNILNVLLPIYERVMVLKVFVDSDDIELKEKYYTSANTHNNNLQIKPHYIDAGFDLFAPGNQENGDDLRFFSIDWANINPVNKLDFKVCCSAKMVLNSGISFNTGYYMYPRSSLSKTQLRLANSTGIIDAGYRGHLIGMFDVVNVSQYNTAKREADYLGKKYDRYLQICAPGLVPIIVEMVENKEELGLETERGDGGFGSTGR
jgi:dUTPase